MDRVQRMVENQKKREEAMKAKDAQAKAEVEAAKPKPAPAPAKPSAAAGQSDKPMENKYSQKRAMYAPLPQTERGKPVLLGGDPQGENILYINGQNVVVRSLKNPLIASMYSEHAYAPTVARYSPCGRYIASGDSAGNIRVWNTEVVQNTVFKTTFERKMLGAGIQEIVWDPESKRMVAVGTGRETFGVGFFTDSGASLGGGITGHSKTITCCDWRPVKPYRLVTGSEDTTVCWFDCPPIKWKKANKGHQRFVNSVKFNPSGSLVLSVGQDKKGFFYDGDSGDQVDEMANSHSGGIYACSWSADGSRVLTASGDRTCQIYDVSSKKTVVTFNMGDDVDDQQVGCLWQGDFLISLSLNGVLNYLDPNSGKVVKQIRGHAKSITSLAYNSATNSFYSGSYDAVINRWNEESGDAQVISGKGGHTNAVKGMAIQPSTSTLVTVGLDDAVRFTPLDAKDYTQTKSAALDSNATGVALSHKGDYSIATSLQSVSVFKGTQKASSVPAPWKPQSVAFSVDDSEVAVGGEDNKVHLFSFSGGQLSEKSVLEGHRGPVTTAAYSPDGKYLATADKNREIVIWDNSSKQPAIKEWVYHTARVNAVAWSPDSAHLASVSLDQNLIIWTAAEPSMRINIKGAHQGSIDNVLWLDNSTVATSGQDATIRTWNINFSKPN